MPFRVPSRHICTDVPRVSPPRGRPRRRSIRSSRRSSTRWNTSSPSGWSTGCQAKSMRSASMSSNMPKGHKYLTLVYQIDLDVTRLLWVGRERTIESFRGFFTVNGDELASPRPNVAFPMRMRNSAATGLRAEQQRAHNSFRALIRSSTTFVNDSTSGGVYPAARKANLV